MATQGTAASVPLARRAREQFVADAQQVLQPMAQAILSRLHELSGSTSNSAERQARHDALVAFDSARLAWIQGTEKAWHAAAVVTPGQPRTSRDSKALELIGDDVVEQKILASRLALSIIEKATWEINDLKLRMQHLEGDAEAAPDDVLRPETLARVLMERWTEAGLTRETWIMVQDVIRKHMVERLLGAYERSNAFLVDKGVLPEIDLSSRVRRSSEGPRTGPSTLRPGTDRGELGARSGAAAVADETRLMTGSTPLARARMRASGVLGQLKRMLTDRLPGFDPDNPAQPSPGLAAALADDATRPQALAGVRFDDDSFSYNTADVEQVAVALRERAGEVKRRAGTSSEKATIEIVALMFQSILAEDRIPPAVRVWFARLQMPVLRVALSEPEFFGSVEHPARLLIDRMGSCVMGFETGGVGGSTLETEIKRVVQVIEQYPETGRRVFQLVYDEFQKFLSRFLTEKSSTQRLVGVAQQLEQKETLAIQYTIEMRHTLNDIPVREEVREFLFKVWSEVLAMAAVKNGTQHAETIALKKAAAELVWAASAKPSKADRARVIQELPVLLQRLRRGMALLGIQAPVQEAHIKVLGDTLADAFQSKTEAIPQAQIEALTSRLAHLEDFLADDPDTDLRLDSNSLEMMLGIDASMIEVVAEGGSKPTEPMIAWAQELQPGNWFSLDHNGRQSHVQYVWRSERKQLHLFAMPDGKSFLMQARRVAAYLQAGLLLPSEEETLTVRATRDALEKLNANPERLLT
jgi:hypothetical protein